MFFKKMSQKTIKIIAIILYSISLVMIFIVGYLIGFDIGKARGASYVLVLTVEPGPNEIEPQASLDKDEI